MEGRLRYKKEQFEAAVADFSVSIKLDLTNFDPDVVDSVKSGRVQKFEFCVELLWKTVKVFLHEIHGIDENSPKMVIKSFYTLEYVSAAEYETLMELLDDRNKLSHVYKKEQFNEIYERLIQTLPLFEKVVGKL
ncbi:MAG: nucleotidyltransferase substrate binding protein [Spirochaetales bacterium]|nr:nucleotidyltransferase substrate binding protein [Spirochaetales bacterium]